MKVIGLTGGTGSGKSEVSKYLQEMGAGIIDADLVARQIVEIGKPAYRQIVAHFGKEILQEDGNILRHRLGEIVFSNAEELAFLNQCTHTYIVQEMQRQIIQYQQEGTAFCIVLDAPLLFEAGLDTLCDSVWVVYADADVRTRRIIKRDGISEQTARARIASQKTWEEYHALSDVILDNSKDLQHLQQQLAQAVKEIKS